MTATHTDSLPLMVHGRQVTARGNLDLLAANARVVITGSRASTTYGETVANDAAQMLAKHGATLIASTGYGIDSAAVRGALATAPDRIILVQPSGLDRPYPRGTTQLTQAVEANGGLILSLRPDLEDTPTRWDFLDAAALRGALAHHALIVEGGIRSGIRGTALTNGAVWAVPGPITSAASHLPHQLLRGGATAWLGDNDDAATIATASDTTHPYYGRHAELLNHRTI